MQQRHTLQDPTNTKKIQNRVKFFTKFYLVIAAHHHLGVEDNVEAEDDRPNYCKNQSCGPSLQMAKVIFVSKGKV